MCFISDTHLRSKNLHHLPLNTVRISETIGPQPPFDFYHEALEATGMFGTVILKIK